MRRKKERKRKKMKDFIGALAAYFTKRNTFKIVVIELIAIGLLMCALLATFVNVEITLNGDETMSVAVGSKFEDPGATAKADGREVNVRVTGAVDTSVAGTYTLCYKASYLLSRAKAYRTVHVVAVDDVLSLTLLGEEKITLSVGAEFVEPGYSATDAQGNDLTDRVSVSGTVDTATAGTYTLTYTVTDGAGNRVERTRTVTVTAAKLPEIVEPEGKTIYLTFDDGPSRYTSELLKVLAKYDVKATFFVVDSSTVNGYSKMNETLKAIADGGHAIGVHSKTHDWSIYDSEEAYLSDLYAMQKIIKDATGVTTNLIRFPGGTSNTVSRKHCEGIMTLLSEKVGDLGFRYFDWDVDSKDAGGATTADAVYNNVIKGIGNAKIAVVLQHDTKQYSVEAVERIIQWGIANGYTFRALSTDSPLCQHKPNN